MLPDRQFAYGEVAAVRRRKALLLLPPLKILPSEQAERSRILYNPGGGYSGPWRNAIAYYLVAPMDSPSNPWVRESIFVGPSQCGKTEILLNQAHHSITADPADMMLVLDEKGQADDFSDRRIKKLVEHSPEVNRRLVKPRRFMFIFEGMTLALSWPTGSQAASKPVPRILMTERDLMPDDLDGEGDPAELYRKRGQTFANAKLVIESSPRRPLLPGKKRPANPHLAPEVTGGILRRYNQGTRKRFYWKCPHCGDWFTPQWDMMHYPAEATPEDEVIPIGLLHDPGCALIEEGDKTALNQTGVWVADGQTLDRDGRLQGVGPRSDIDSYWLIGICSAFLTWRELVVKFLRAKREQAKTGRTDALKAWWNTDLGEPFLDEEGEEEQLDATTLRARANPNLVRRMVPDWVRFLIASVDVQKTSFKVLIRGYGPDLTSTVVDYFTVFRTSDDADAEPIAPALYAEHWDLLVEKVIEAKIPLASDPARSMRVLSTAIDLQGESGVTTQAYDFARRCRRRGIADDRVMLVRGGKEPGAVLITPAAIDKDSKGKPLKGGLLRYTLNVFLLKDTTSAQLRRKTEGVAFVDLPAWLPEAAFEELCAERKIGGEWIRDGANELFDLLGYAQANAARLQALRINWADPPGWACPQDINTLVVETDHAEANAVRQSVITPDAPHPPPAAAPAPAGDWLGDRGSNWF